MALLDNLLLQQAADTVPSIFEQPQNFIRLPVVRELPKDYGGVWNSTFDKGASSLAFSLDIKNHTNSPDFIDYGNVAFPGAIDTHCVGSCSASVIGFGFNITCDPDQQFGQDHDFEVTPESVLAYEKFSEEEAARETANNFTLADLLILPALLRVEVQWLEAGPSSYNQSFPFDVLQILTDYSRLVPNSGNSSSCKATVFERVCYFRKFTRTLSNNEA
jgi:hypothetical protein